MTATIDPTYAAMLAPILSHPDDDCWRLQFADWFADNGDEARASFICVQCELETLDRKQRTFLSFALDSSRQMYLRRREAELLTENYGLRWAMPLLDTMGWSNPAAIVGSWTWKRGFISEITCTWADCRDNLDAILAEHPVETVTLSTMIGIGGPESARGIDDMYIVDHDIFGRGGPTDPPKYYGYLKQLLGKRWPSIKTWNLPR